MDLTNLQGQFMNFVTIIVGGALSVCSVYATIYINKALEIAKAKAEQIKDEKAKKIVDNTLEKTANLIKTNIVALENTAKQELIKSIADGKIDKSELNQLAMSVQQNVLTQLGDESLNILNNSLGDVSGYISSKIEETLADLKLDQTSSVSKTVITQKNNK
jgi:hypothetical protein